jgi:hypothetical protein
MSISHDTVLYAAAVLLPFPQFLLTPALQNKNKMFNVQKQKTDFRVGIRKAKSNSCAIGFTKSLFTVVY